MGRVKKNQTTIPAYNVKPETVDKLKELALECGFKYGDGVAMGAFLDRLAEVDRDLLKILIKKG